MVVGVAGVLLGGKVVPVVRDDPRGHQHSRNPQSWPFYSTFSIQGGWSS